MVTRLLQSLEGRRQNDQVYMKVNILSAATEPTRHDITANLVVDAPSTARDTDADERFEYWESCEHLQRTRTVVLIVVSNHAVRAHLGLVASSRLDIAESSKFDQNRIHLLVSFLDPDIALTALRADGTFAVLVDDSLILEPMQPLLQRHLSSSVCCIAPGKLSDGGQAGGPPEEPLVPGPDRMTVPSLEVINPLVVTHARCQLNTYYVPISDLPKLYCLSGNATARNLLRLLRQTLDSSVVRHLFSSGMRSHPERRARLASGSHPPNPLLVCKSQLRLDVHSEALLRLVLQARYCQTTRRFAVEDKGHILTRCPTSRLRAAYDALQRTALVVVFSSSPSPETLQFVLSSSGFLYNFLAPLAPSLVLLDEPILRS